MTDRRAAVVVFTDLDATLLDHHDYDWQAARPALEALAARGIPVCPITSKTVPEVRRLRRALANAHPFAVENGAAIAWPADYFEAEAVGVPDTEAALTIETLGADRDTLLVLVERLKAQHGSRFTGFAHMSVDQIAVATGLDTTAAAEAGQRRASEALLWHDDEAALARFTTAVEAAGAKVRVGGRFVHVLGADIDKGRALRELRARFEARHGSILAIGLGDSANDADLLEAADIGYWVARPDGSYHGPAAGRIRHAEGIGPAGWTAAISDLIARDEI